MGPEGAAEMVTDGVTGDVSDKLPKLVPAVPVVIPAMPVTDEVYILPAEEDVDVA